MVIIDTTIWIEFFRMNPEYVVHVKDLLSSQMVVGLHVIGAELLQGAKNQRETDSIQSIFENLPEPGYSVSWLEAGIFSQKNNLINLGIGIIDAFIIRTSLMNNSKVWTLDKKIMLFTPEQNLYRFGTKK